MYFYYVYSDYTIPDRCIMKADETNFFPDRPDN